MMMMITALFLLQATLVSGERAGEAMLIENYVGTRPELSSNGNLSVTIISNVTDGIICHSKSVQLTCRANDVNITAYKWTSSAFKEVKVTASITIIATDDPVGYTCTVTDSNGDNGYSSVNISSNATTPVLYEVNFNMDKTVFVGNHVNLTVQIISNISLNRMLWSRLNADLPKDSRVVNYSQDGSIYTSLIIHKANYANDGGLYYLNTSNHCGLSSISVELNIDKEVKCFPPGQPVPLLSITSNQTTVEEVAITYTCIFKGNYSPITYGDIYWVLKIQNGSSITIFDYSNFSDYYINTYRNCPQDNYACCQFVTELWMHTTLPLNNAMISCVAIYDSVPSYNTSNLEVIQRPVLTRGPTNVIGVVEDETVHFECHFNSSLIQYLAICDWLKDGDPPMNGDKWQSEEPGYENRLICGFSISRVSMVDEGNYSCYCHYNESFRDQLHIPKSEEIRSQSGEAILEIKSHKSAHDVLSTIIVLISCLSVPTVIFVIWRVEKCRSRKPVYTTIQDTADTDRNRYKVNEPNRKEYNDENEDSLSNGSIRSASLQSLGQPTQADNSDSEGSCVEQAHSATVEPLLSYQPNTQVRDNPDLAAVPSISEFITITEQPKDQIIQFKNDKEIVKLTCCAESFEGHNLCYQWYCDDSSTLISTKQCDEIELKRPSRNKKKRYYCKISIVNQPLNYVLSQKIVIQLQIIWFTDQPKDTTVFAGKKLEISCTANTLRAMKVKYSWYKCLESGEGKAPTGHVGNRMTIQVCSANNDDYYLCEAAATKQGIVFDAISSEVARVRVINSINISITKQPRCEVFITFGEELKLECTASCGNHPVNYQWYNSNEPLPGATQPMLIIPTAYEKDVGSYYCEVTSEYSEATMRSQSTQVRMIMNRDRWIESQRSQVQAETFTTIKGVKDKMALLIGNGDYKGKPLRCPRNDVKAMTERLQQLNFKTLSLVDLTLSQMTDAINYFCSFLGSGIYAVFFYSGHGAELHKTTYFVPIDADDKDFKIAQLYDSDFITHKLQKTQAKIIMVLDCCRKALPTEGLEMPTEKFDEHFSFNTICKIHACATSFETFELNGDENSFMTKALLYALDCSGGKMLKNDLCDRIMEYYKNYNISALERKQLIRPRMLYGLIEDLSLEDPIWPPSTAKDLLLNFPKECSLHFNNPIMKSTYKSISLCFEAEFSNILIVHICCNTAKQPILKETILLHDQGLSLVELKSKGIASFKISNLLLLIDVREKNRPLPKLQCTFHMPQDTSVIDQIEYVFR